MELKTYLITLKNCAFFAHHGVLAEETALGQRFFVDAELEVEAGDALETDRVDATVDYGLAFSVIDSVVSERPRKLIEALAHDIAKALCVRFKTIVRATITVRKPAAPVPGILDHAEVRVEYCP